MGAPLEFIDYIFDRYAFLNIAPSASTDEIRVEVRRRRAANHPDKLIHVSEAIRLAAQREMDTVNECARILLDEPLRERFDEKLQEFREAAPRLISTSGTPILDPTRFRVDVESLLDANIQDFSVFEQAAAQMSGYNEKRLARALSNLAKYPDDFDAREQARDELTTKLVFLTVIEDYYWQRAGVSGAVDRNSFDRAASPDAVLEHLAQTVSKVKEGIGTNVSSRNSFAQLGLAPMLLLGHHAPDTDASTVTSEVVLAATQAFEVRIEDLKQLVERKKETMEELLKVSRFKMLQGPTESNFIDIALVRTEGEISEDWPSDATEQLGILMRLDLSTEVISPVLEKISVEDMATWPNELHVLEPNREIPSMFMEAVNLAEQRAVARKGE